MRDRVVADRYELIELIGQGGMADVYLAKDNILNRTIAIKLLRTSLAKDSVYVERFQREATAAAALSGKNIVDIYDVGEDGSSYYIVMEYVPGTTLKELVRKRGALHYVEAVDVMSQVAKGASKAHKLGIVHRDLKPQNILVTDAGIAKIADFGIASIQSLAQVTQTDVVMGSLHYLAPELAKGESASAQSDVYALGVILYELLHGEVPFKGESPVNIAMSHMREEFPSIREFNNTIPQSVENIITKATAKNVIDRYADAGEMFEDLSTCLENPNVEKLVIATDVEPDPTLVVPTTQLTGETTSVTEQTKEGFFQRIKAWPIWAKILSSLAIIGLLIGSVFLLIMNNNVIEEMPDVTGMTLEQAENLLEDYDITISDTVLYELSEDYDEGEVVASNPEAGEQLESGEVVTLTVSSGKYIIVGDYVGMTYEKASSALTKLGFTVSEELVISDEAEGIVTAQSIEEGFKQDPSEENPTITLSVSKGSYIVVDDYTGMTYDYARSKLEDLGFTVKQSVQESETVAEGVIISQSVASGTTIDPTNSNKSITLYVSSGYSRTVPDVIGLSYSEATSTLEELDFVVELKEVETEDQDVTDGEVFEQSVEAGTTVTSSGTTVTISYYTVIEVEETEDISTDTDTEDSTSADESTDESTDTSTEN